MLLLLLLLLTVDGTFDLLEPHGGEVEGRRTGACSERSIAAGTINGRCRRLLLVDGQGLRQCHVQGRVDIALVAGLRELAHEATAPRGPAALRGIERHAAAAAAAASAVDAAGVTRATSGACACAATVGCGCLIGCVGVGCGCGLRGGWGSVL